MEEVPVGLVEEILEEIGRLGHSLFMVNIMPAKILIVEDHPDLRQMLVNMMRTMNYDVIEAETGEKGIEKALAEGPDLIIMDLLLPGINGVEAALRLKRNPKTAHIPIIAHTVYDMEYREKALAAGMAAVLIKPISRHLLRKSIERFLALSQRETVPFQRSNNFPLGNDGIHKSHA